jgi:hypothetical protein
MSNRIEKIKSASHQSSEGRVQRAEAEYRKLKMKYDEPKEKKKTLGKSSKA